MALKTHEQIGLEMGRSGQAMRLKCFHIRKAYPNLTSRRQVELCTEMNRRAEAGDKRFAMSQTAVATEGEEAELPTADDRDDVEASEATSEASRIQSLFLRQSQLGPIVAEPTAPRTEEPAARTTVISRMSTLSAPVPIEPPAMSAYIYFPAMSTYISNVRAAFPARPQESPAVSPRATPRPLSPLDRLAEVAAATVPLAVRDARRLPDPALFGRPTGWRPLGDGYTPYRWSEIDREPRVVGSWRPSRSLPEMGQDRNGWSTPRDEPRLDSFLYCPNVPRPSDGEKEQESS